MPPGGWHEPIPPAPVPAGLAGWWRRAAAALIDGILVLLPALLLAGGITALLAGPARDAWVADGGAGVAVGALILLISVLSLATTVVVTALVYAPLTMRRGGSRNGQTWGKQLLAIRVVRIGGEPQSISSALMREVFVKLLLFGVLGGTLTAIPAILDVLWPLWDPQRRALHDMVVDTRVVRVWRT